MNTYFYRAPPVAASEHFVYMIEKKAMSTCQASMIKLFVNTVDGF